MVRQKLGLPATEKATIPEPEVASSQDGCKREARLLESSGGIESPEFFSICDLSDSEIEQFSQLSGVENASAFVEQIAKHDARSFASRPQDLKELIEYWHSNGCVGTRYERVSHYIERRLIERDPDRSMANELTANRAREGAMQLAAAVTLTKRSRIKVPGAETNDAIDIREVLNDWTSGECSAILQMPVFDQAIYGTVRFHHRVVREFLTAQWILRLLELDGSQSKVHQLFFQHKYGCEVVIPTMRPVVPWVALENGPTLDRLVKLSPDLLVEYGDPTRIPLPHRIQILKGYCKQKAEYHDRWNIDRAGLVRFSKRDLVPTIRELLTEYAGCTDVIDILLEFILYGELEELSSEVTMIALDSDTDNYTRVWALRGLAKIGSYSEKKRCVGTHLSDEWQLTPSVLTEILNEFADHFTNTQIVRAFGQLPCLEGIQNSALVDAISNYLDQCSPTQLLEMISGTCELLKGEPFINDSCTVSAQFRWLVEPAVGAVESLLRRMDSLALNPAVFELLNTVSILNTCGGDFRNIEHQLEQLIPRFQEFNRKLFWKSIEQVRSEAEKNGERIEYWWRARLANRFWQFDDNDFDFFVDEVNSRSIEDDRLVALSLAFAIYKNNGRPQRWYRALTKIVKGQAFLESRLYEFFHPKAKSEEVKRLNRVEACLRKRRNAQKAKEAQWHAEWKQYISNNKEQLRDVSIAREGSFWNSQRYLLDRLRDLPGNDSNWSKTNYRELVAEHGEEVVAAFRDGLIDYWREYRPKVRSEGIENPNSVPVAISIALSGLAIESTEVASWPRNLTTEEVILAARLALWEMNGFPAWFQRLHREFMHHVNELVQKELTWELTSESDGTSSYVLQDLRWHGKWMYDDFAEHLLHCLDGNKIKVQEKLSDSLWIINRSSVGGPMIGEVAHRKCAAEISLNQKALWFALWIDTDCASAIEHLELFVDSLPSSSEADNFVVQFLNFLLGESGRDFHSHRFTFKKAKFIHRLYLIAKKHVRFDEDIDRAGKGSYSPTARDHAQRARSALSSLLAETPGKVAYLCLKELGESLGAEGRWFTKLAKERAVKDADLQSWRISDLNSFTKTFEYVPHSHRELFNLVVSRFIDLKEDLEHGDSSVASILINTKDETEHRKFIGNWLRDRANGKYSVPQEEELADAKRPDIRIHAAALDAPVPIELKIADKWTGPSLFERLKNQLIGDYLRDRRTNCGMFVLVFQGEKSYWETQRFEEERLNFEHLIQELQKLADELVNENDNAEQVRVLGIDLTLRSRN